MIQVDRSRVADPFDPSTPLGRRAHEEIQQVSESIKSDPRRDRHPTFKAYLHPTVKAALRELFQGKCAYCESTIDAASLPDVEQFRPKGRVTEAPDHPGYWWLANTWDNLLAACANCNRQSRHEIANEEISQLSGKGARFPLKDERMRVFHPTDDLGSETPLLLNPTMGENPEDHLVFNDQGLVFSDTELGNTSIAVLGLNRMGLVQERKRVLGTFQALKAATMANLHAGAEDDSKTMLSAIMRMGDDSAPYTAMMRQHIQMFLNELNTEETKRHGDELRSGTRVSKARLRRAKSSTDAFAADKSDYSLNTEEGVRKFLSQNRYVQSISLRNIRAIRTLELNLEEMTGNLNTWLMFLGENGTGKSSVLQSLALVLSGPRQALELIKQRQLDPASMVRYRCKSGHIKVKINGFTEPHELTIYRDRLDFNEPHGEVQTVSLHAETAIPDWHQPTFVLGFGATRLLPRDDAPPTTYDDPVRIGNLFDAIVPLSDARSWLLSLGQKQWLQVEDVLLELLDLDNSARLKRSKAETKVWVTTPSSKTELKDLSDGYQTVIAVAVDLMAMFLLRWPKLSEAMALVLIDELDAHLHPTWQMKIVGSLREAFPGVQFIATSHQPLCLRGLSKGEVVVMKREDDGSVSAISDLPSPKDFRVDQLLTSEFFGLRSTIDPATEAMFDDYYALLALKDPTPDQNRDLEKLRKVLEGRDHMGTTERERLYYTAIDELLAKQTTADRRSPENLQEEAVTRIKEIWEQLVNHGNGVTR